MNNDTNPHISGLLLVVTWLEVVILMWAGLGLLLYPPVMCQRKVVMSPFSQIEMSP